MSAKCDDEHGSSYRSQIISLLESRDRKLRQVQNMFKNYSFLAEQLNRSRRVRSQNNGSFDSKSDASLEIQQMKEELASVYKLKSKNDQDLIEANRRLTESETRLSSLQTERDILLKDLQRTRVKLEGLENEINKLQLDNTTINDERIALLATCNTLTEKKKELEAEQFRLMNKVRELSARRVEYMNEEVALQEERRQLRVREEIALASQDAVRDENAFRISPDTSGDDLLGDFVPSSRVFSFVCNDGEVNDVEWLGDNVFATAGSDQKIRIWRAGPHSESSKMHTMTGCNSAVTRLHFDGEKRLLLCSSNDKTCRVWNVDTQRLMCTLSGHIEKVSTARFYKTHEVISGSFDRTIKNWDLAGQRCLKTYFPGSTVLDIVSCRGTTTSSFISGHYDKKVRFWDSRQMEPLRTVEMEQRVTSLDISLDGQQLLCSTRDETLSLIDVRNYGTLHMYSAEQYKTTSDVSRCVFSPGGEFVAAGSSQGCVFVWNTKTTRLEKVLRGGHESPILSLSWNPMGPQFLYHNFIARGAATIINLPGR
ncbi:unnamed protein product [Caenorhabditis auriculariae]|uniref:Autophagy-related protein 16 domain-containing protein n=1 Tax=Caenorhabditis auriculariae TaxID=2777116 RepID=A0A8S1HHS4_9PELO|nr:unnamed protein product [Caenorhabditis auriculariae]